MKAIKTLLAVSVLAAAGATNAATYNLTGWGSTTALGGAITLAALEWVAGSGTVDDTGGVFNSAFFNYTQNITSPLDLSVNATITGTLSVSATGAIVDTYTGCTGSVAVCNPIAPLVYFPQDIQASSFDFSNLASLTWTTTSYSSAPGFGITTTVAVFTASPVPVPAAAWLFGSALVGVAGAARRRKAA